MANERDVLEIYFLSHGSLLGDSATRGSSQFQFVVKECSLSDLIALESSPAQTPRLVVLTEDQFLDFHQQCLPKNTKDQFLRRFILVKTAARTRLPKAIRENYDGLIAATLREKASKQNQINEFTNAAHGLLLDYYRNKAVGLEDTRDRNAWALNTVGLAMADQHNLDELMKVFLDKAVEVSSSDAGFLLLRENLMSDPEGDEGMVKLLRRMGTKYIQKVRTVRSQSVRVAGDMFDPNRSEFTARVSNRGCGVRWAEGQESPEFWRANFVYAENSWPAPKFEFDTERYFVKSFCVFPIKTPSEEVVGLILLVNRRVSSNVQLKSLEDVRDGVVEYGDHDLVLLETLSSHIGVSIDHTRLYRELKTVFESFVQASVTAIESRDPSTKGHSERVAMMTVAFAESVNQVHSGPYGSLFFTPSQLYELKYASLLHDFGKIGVREDVLRKENKLYSHELEIIRERFEIIEKRLHVKCLERYIESLMRRNAAPTPEELNRIHREVRRVSEDLHGLWDAILDANEPQVVQDQRVQKIIDMASTRLLMEDETIQLMTSDEITKLNIRRGSLSDAERIEIENHVTHSYRFLIQIPWTSELANIPDIVYAHHERLNGSGYPRKLVSDEIPVQARLMAIADIYDALVAMDRPYKKAVTHERALDILDSEVQAGKLDRDLFQIFIEARIGDLIRDISVRVA